MTKRTKLILAISVALSTLTACGGGSDSATSNAFGTNLETVKNSGMSVSDEVNKTSKVGYFIDSEVSGLDYVTSSGKKGTTNKLGQFFYESGDKVTFLLGKMELGTAAPDEEGLVTPKVLADQAAAGDQEKSKEIEILMLRLLQSLDTDNKPENGITIDPKVQIELEKISATDIADLNEASLLSFSSKLSDEIDEDHDGQIDVNTEDAKKHAEQSLENWDNGIRPEDGHKGDAVDLTKYANAELTDKQKKALVAAWNEEKLAKETFLELNKLYPENGFKELAAEIDKKNIQLIDKLAEKYALNLKTGEDYATSTLNQFGAETLTETSSDSLQNSFEDILDKAKLSKADALQSGCMIEVNEVDNLDTHIAVANEVKAEDFVAVFEKIKTGNYDYYWAFDKALKAEGVTDGCASLGIDYAKTEAEYPISSDSKLKDEAENAIDKLKEDAKDKAENAKDEAENAKDEAENAKDEAENAKDEAENAKDKLKEDAKDEAENAKDEAENAKDEAENAKDEAENAKDEAENAKDEAENAKDEAENAKDEVENAKDEAENAKDEAENAKDEAENAKDEAENAIDKLKEDAKDKAENAKDEAGTDAQVTGSIGSF